MSRKAKIFLALGLYFGITILLVVIAGNEGKNEEFQPQNEFLLDPWISIQTSASPTCRSTRRCSTSSSPRWRRSA